MIKKLNTELFNFLWNSKTDKVKREIVIKKYLEGGLNMIHLVSYINSLKLTWIRRLYCSSSKWQEIVKTEIDEKMLALCGIEYITQCQNKSKNIFWKDVFKALKQVLEKLELCDNYVSSVKEVPIWHNNKITIENKCVFYKEWFNKGVTIIDDFIKVHENNSLYSFQEFKEKFHIDTNFLQYYGICCTIQKYLRLHDNQVDNFSHPNIPANLKIIWRNKKGAKTFYNVLLNNSSISTGRKKWDEIFEFDEVAWKNIYKIPFHVTRQTSLQWLQYRINHFILTTNSYMYKIGIVNSPYCNRCNTDVETIEHALWECDLVQNFLNEFCGLLDSLYIPFLFNKETFIFGLFNNLSGIFNSVDNLILLLIKQYIYKTRCLQQSLSTHCLKLIIKDHYNILNYINSKDEKCKQTFQNKWNKWKSLPNVE